MTTSTQKSPPSASCGHRNVSVRQFFRSARDAWVWGMRSLVQNVKRLCGKLVSKGLSTATSTANFGKHDLDKRLIPVSFTTVRVGDTLRIKFSTSAAVEGAQIRRERIVSFRIVEVKSDSVLMERSEFVDIQCDGL